MINKVKIFAPATIANVGSGFDVLGFAIQDLGDIIELRKRTDDKLVIQEITGAELPYDPEKNIVGIVLQKMLEESGQKVGLDIFLEKRVLPGSGLGSSASSAVGSVVALDKLLGLNNSQTELTRYAMEGEKFVSLKAHADNVAPSIFGGFTLIRSYEPLDIIKIPTGVNPYISIIHPQIEIKTADAKKILKENIPLSKAIKQWGNLGALVLGISQGDYDLMARSMQDIIAEPARSLLIPGFGEAKELALSEGAIGFNISGSGPTMFCMARETGKAKIITEKLTKFYNDIGIEVKGYVSKISEEGAREI